MKVKPIKIKIKEPTPTAADRLYAKHQAIRKAKGLPDPSVYKKKLSDMKKEQVEQLDEISSDTAKSYLDKIRFKQAKRAVKANMGAPREKPLAAAALDRTAKSMELARKRIKEQVEQLDELSPATKASYKSKALAQVKEMKPWTKKGEYKDLAKNAIAKREKGIARVSEDTELDEQLYKKARFVSGPAKKPFKSNTNVSPQTEEVKPPTGGLKDACWKSYTAVGMKMKNGRKVPNCVPVKEEAEEPSMAARTLSRKAQIVKAAAKSKKEEKEEASDKFQKDPELSSDIHKT